MGQGLQMDKAVKDKANPGIFMGFRYFSLKEKFRIAENGQQGYAIPNRAPSQ